MASQRSAQILQNVRVKVIRVHGLAGFYIKSLRAQRAEVRRTEFTDPILYL